MLCYCIAVEGVKLLFSIVLLFFEADIQLFSRLLFSSNSHFFHLRALDYSSQQVRVAHTSIIAKVNITKACHNQ